MDKKSIVTDIYQVAVISVFAVGYSMTHKHQQRIDFINNQRRLERN